MKTFLVTLALMVGQWAHAQATPAALKKPIEFYFYIASHNDMLSVDEGKTHLPQGEVTLGIIQGIAEKAPNGSAFHIFYAGHEQKGSSGLKDAFYARYENGVKTVQESRYGASASNPNTLTEFLKNRVYDQRVAVLTIWGHGRGFRDVPNFDDSTPALSFNLLKQAALLEKTPMDLVILDQCAMATIETVSALEAVSPLILASQYELPVSGIQYAGLSETLRLISQNGSDNSEMISMQIAETLRKDTLAFLKVRKLFAPLVILQTSGIQTLIQAMNQAYQDILQFLSKETNLAKRDNMMATLVARSRPQGQALFPNDPYLVDLRGIATALEKGLKQDPKPLLEAFSMVSPGAYGSISFMMAPKLPGRFTADEKLQFKPYFNEIWNQNLMPWKGLSQ